MSRTADNQATDSYKPGFGKIYSRFLAQAVGTIVLLGLLGYAPTVNLAGKESVSAMFLALAVAWVASIIGTIPVILARDKGPLEAMPSQFGAMAARLVATLLLGLAITLGGWIEVRPFLMWLVIGHIALLVTDTMLAQAVVKAAAERETEGALEER